MGRRRDARRRADDRFLSSALLEARQATESDGLPRNALRASFQRSAFSVQLLNQRREHALDLRGLLGQFVVFDGIQ